MWWNPQLHSRRETRVRTPGGVVQISRPTFWGIQSAGVWVHCRHPSTYERPGCAIINNSWQASSTCVPTDTHASLACAWLQRVHPYEVHDSDVWWRTTTEAPSPSGLHCRSRRWWRSCWQRRRGITCWCFGEVPLVHICTMAVFSRRAHIPAEFGWSDWELCRKWDRHDASLVNRQRYRYLRNVMLRGHRSSRNETTTTLWRSRNAGWWKDLSDDRNPATATPPPRNAHPDDEEPEAQGRLPSDANIYEQTNAAFMGKPIGKAYIAALQAQLRRIVSCEHHCHWPCEHRSCVCERRRSPHGNDRAAWVRVKGPKNDIITVRSVCRRCRHGWEESAFCQVLRCLVCMIHWAVQL